jgi:hypothetical protein
LMIFPPDHLESEENQFRRARYLSTLAVGGTCGS